MKTIFLLLIIVLSNSFLQAESNYDGYQKKIILLRSSSKSRIDLEFKKFKKNKIYKKLNVLAKRYNFVIHSRALGKNTILVVEPIYKESVYKKVIKLVKPRYKDARGVKDKITKRKPVRKQIIKAVKIKKVQKPIVKKVEKKLTKKNIIKTKKVVQTKIIKKDVTKKDSWFSSWFSWWYILWIIIFGVFYRYYIKFKKIYDEY